MSPACKIISCIYQNLLQNEIEVLSRLVQVSVGNHAYFHNIAPGICHGLDTEPVPGQIFMPSGAVPAEGNRALPFAAWGAPFALTLHRATPVVILQYCSGLGPALL